MMTSELPRFLCNPVPPEDEQETLAPEGSRDFMDKLGSSFVSRMDRAAYEGRLAAVNPIPRFCEARQCGSNGKQGNGAYEGILNCELTKEMAIQATGVASSLVEKIQGIKDRASSCKH
ncbi:hypothetical protein Droror1_Dr00015116 [Drosera rotundifolia]